VCSAARLYSRAAEQSVSVIPNLSNVQDRSRPARKCAHPLVLIVTDDLVAS